MSEKTTANCRVCQIKKEIHWSLPLEKTNGQWVVTPVCDECRHSLAAQAEAERVFLPIYKLKVSEAEAEKRNARLKLNQPFLEKFGRPKAS